jgi:hypothetical protein
MMNPAGALKAASLTASRHASLCFAIRIKPQSEPSQTPDPPTQFVERPFSGIALFALMIVPLGGPATMAEAGWSGAKSKYKKSHRSKRYRSSRRRGKRVQERGYRARRGGYSYLSQDVINTYGGGRARYGGVNAYRDPFSDRQTNSGPFYYGLFFDSAIAPRGGDPP